MPRSSMHRKGHSLALFNDTIRLGIYQTPCFRIHYYAHACNEIYFQKKKKK